MKDILKLVAGIVLGVCVGLAAAVIIAHLAGKDIIESPADLLLMGKAILIALTGLLAGVLINTILHEAGHMLGGLATGYSFSSFRILQYTLIKGDNGYKWAKFNIPGTLGQCIMIPPQVDDALRMPYFWYNVGGLVVNVLIFAIAGYANWALDVSPFMHTFCAMLAFISAWMLLVNGIPMTPGGIPNDAKNILVMWRNPQARIDMARMLLASREQTLGKRVSEMPAEWFESQPVTSSSSALEVGARLLTMALLTDQLRLVEARAIGDELLAMGKSLPAIYKMEVVSDMMLLCLATQGRQATLNDDLWNKKQEQYVTSMEKYMPMKSATLMARALILDSNRDAAMKHYDFVKDHISTYSAPGEAHTALAVMDHILQQYPIN